MKRYRPAILGIAIVMAFAALWHGPLGNAAQRFTAETETIARLNLEYYEMDGQVAVAMERAPLTRRLWLTGRADDFQRSELVRILDGIPAVGDVQWWRPEGGTVRGDPLLPLIVEVELAALAGFGFGMIVAFLVALRRRAIRWSKI
ncbi:hypothetical protein [Sphingomicrobium lutaoense]|uniref:Uncharacterized protein n=1 Tax=Sphingomicrobium lutaoense TaxID=515949 RepID=A0A839Z4P5_9SPHN|nr:hypothetical protein [Sphingomicrobium lutaoense]MBB3764582.1 hypothetical protein [Sphingomicrobium lutaoense]